MLYMAAYASFWLANWKEYNTGILQTSVGQFGVTECQYSTMVVHLLTAIYGQSFWKISLMEIAPASITSKITSSVLLNAFNMHLGGMVAYYFGLLIILVTLF